MIARLLVAGLALMAWAGCATGQATPGVAVLLELSGAAEPAFAALDEVPKGTTIKLTADAKLTFAHYQSCRTVTVQGGSVELGFTRYSLEGSTTVQEERACPKRLQLNVGAELPKEVGTPIHPKLPLVISRRPIFLLTGARALEFSSVELRDEDRTATSLPLQNRRAILPDRVPELRPNQRYELRLVPNSSSAPFMNGVVRATSSMSDASIPIARSVLLPVQ